jgi:hypothetical protein
MDTKEKLFGVAFGAAFLLGVINEKAQGQTCGCLNPNQTAVQGSGLFKYLGSATAGYEVDLPSNQNFGFMNHSSTPPTVFWDYKPSFYSLQQTQNVEVCRINFSGSTVVCSPVYTDTIPAGSTAPRDTQVPLGTNTGVAVWGSSTSVWDHYVLKHWTGFLNPTDIDAALSSAAANVNLLTTDGTPPNRGLYISCWS